MPAGYLWMHNAVPSPLGLRRWVLLRDAQTRNRRTAVSLRSRNRILGLRRLFASCHHKSNSALLDPGKKGLQIHGIISDTYHREKFACSIPPKPKVPGGGTGCQCIEVLSGLDLDGDGQVGGRAKDREINRQRYEEKYRMESIDMDSQEVEATKSTMQPKALGITEVQSESKSSLTSSNSSNSGVLGTLIK